VKSLVHRHCRALQRILQAFGGHVRGPTSLRNLLRSVIRERLRRWNSALTNRHLAHSQFGIGPQSSG